MTVRYGKLIGRVPEKGNLPTHHSDNNEGPNYGRCKGGPLVPDETVNQATKKQTRNPEDWIENAIRYGRWVGVRECQQAANREEHPERDRATKCCEKQVKDHAWPFVARRLVYAHRRVPASWLGPGWYSESCSSKERTTIRKFPAWPVVVPANTRSFDSVRRFASLFARLRSG